MIWSQLFERADKSIERINSYPANKLYQLQYFYPLDSALSIGESKLSTSWTTEA